MAEKTIKTKQTEPEKPKFKLFQKARTVDKDKDRDKSAQPKPNRLAKWYRETIGELRKVSWPTTQDTWKLTKIVLIVMGVMGIVLWFFDFLFSTLISLLVA